MERLRTTRVRALLAGVCALVLVAGAGTAYALKSSKVRPVKEVNVYDSDGRRVGELSAFSGGDRLAVRIEAGGLLATLSLDENSVVNEAVDNTAPEPLYFVSADCSGPPLLAGFQESDDLVPQVKLNHGRLYAYAGPPNDDLQVHSLLDFELGCTPTDLQGQFSPSRFLADLNAEYDPPFEARWK